ncbi:hypothetical protein NMY22_g15063 [Coprinellus aureogranulatus]|nr:hypothetical protein NMY22_g15063 [Coprinellus aureogranulatus]
MMVLGMCRGPCQVLRADKNVGLHSFPPTTTTPTTMATAVETFMTLGDNSRTSSRQSTNPPEVIDVDLLDDDDVQIVSSTHRPRPRRRPLPPLAGPSRAFSGTSTPETIDLVDDSDDEGAGPSTSTSRRGEFPSLKGSFYESPQSHARRCSVERRRLFSPPPRINGASVLIPPVPRVPAQYAGHTSMVHGPPSRLAPPPPAPVRAVDRAFQFNFGRTASPAAGPSNRQGSAAPQAAPRSHHVPSLGLGGAMISDNRARLAAERRAGIPRSHIAEGYLSQRDPTRISACGAVRKPLSEPEHYKPFYTHPHAPEPGFTNDFAPEENPAEGSSTFPQTSKSEPIVILDEDDKTSTEKKEEIKMNTLLVCARCNEPLVLNSGLTGPDATNRRIWALRCGHLIDGKCLAEIGQPTIITNDRKGKGKAKEEIPYGQEDPALSATNASLNQDDAVDPTPDPPSTSIRSRLRSHTSAASTAASTGDPHHPPATSTGSGSAASSRKRKRAPTKATSNKKPKVEAEFEWKCPVPTCNRVHVSVKMNGVWGPEKERMLKKGPLVDLESAPRGVLAVFA